MVRIQAQASGTQSSISIIPAATSKNVCMTVVLFVNTVVLPT